jgi:hypothetical protein
MIGRRWHFHLHQLLFAASNAPWTPLTQAVWSYLMRYYGRETSGQASKKGRKAAL